MLSWERIVDIAKNPECAANIDYRTPVATAAYQASGCGLELDFSDEWMLVRNMYPYSTEPGIAHFVLFRRRDLPMISPRDFLARLSGDVEWFENPPARRSITSVRHYHVFVRAQPRCTVDVRAQALDGYESWLLYAESNERDERAAATK
jgi:hypothetical protein